MTNFSKIGKSNRSRGASYERKCANMLTEALGEKFKRSPRSGALLRDGAINGVFIGGDLSCSKPFIFNIECKNCNDSDIDAILKNPNTAPLVKYWCQCIYDADASSTSTNKKFPLMFFYSKPLRKDFVVVCDKGYNYIFNNKKKPHHIYIPSIPGPVMIKMDNKEQKMTNISPMYIVVIDDLLDSLEKDKVFY